MKDISIKIIYKHKKKDINTEKDIAIQTKNVKATEQKIQRNLKVVSKRFRHWMKKLTVKNILRKDREP